MKRVLSALLAAVLILSLSSVILAENPEPERSSGVPPVVSATVGEIEKYGNFRLSISCSDFFAQGYAWGDIVNVSILNQVLEMPVVSNFSDVDQGSMLFRAVRKEDLGEDYIVLAINIGDLATTIGLATRETTDADPGYIWHYNEGVSEPVPVLIEMKEQGGYYDLWAMHQLARSEKREDYPDLTDAEFANFRMIRMGSIPANRLYRSSSPVDPEICRNTYADAAAARAGIKTFINLADNEETMRGYEGFEETYYSHQNIIALNLGLDFFADDFRAGLARAMRFIIENDGPYLVHCVEGKDRAGYLSALLECLMGATEEEIVSDYMLTFKNFYRVEPGTAQYEMIANNNIRKTLCTTFGLETLAGADLQSCAEAFLKSIGLSPEEIEALRARLGGADAQPAPAGMRVGGWAIAEHGAEALPEGAQAAFDKATENLDGAVYTPVTLMATQVVAGTNYCILCQISPVVPDAKPAWALVYIYADLRGNAEITNVYELYIDRHAAPAK